MIGKIRATLELQNWMYLISDCIANSRIWYCHFLYDRQIHCEFTNWKILGYKTQMAQILFSESGICVTCGIQFYFSVTTRLKTRYPK